ncbi:hypothetical protein [Kineococcus radiotolerans]|uniref:Uncharacterized protein n=1 Tax=Kineococcus radiotolerans (strain ATCC BAA-149 / DSM 14245 / SRS30216) TaxID=266940 RepID=A6W8U7_KINRD|nr:hypothetical protein [Kineococcus radiotolerans]ABS03236.1 hypothetical protein Krad_1750 [Kineococcus radiotolerans SRS30216 = ATCC BAA-149]
MTAHQPLFSDRDRRAVDAIVAQATAVTSPKGQPKPTRWTLFIAAPTDTGGRACWMPEGHNEHRAAVWRQRLVFERARVGLADQRISRLHLSVIPGASRRPERDYQPTISLIRGALPSDEHDVVFQPVEVHQRPGILIHAWGGQ